MIEETEQLSQAVKTTPIKVLIADDDLATRMLLRAAIQQWGYEVIEASDGEEAWEKLQVDDPPPLLIIDWLMPKLDGIQLCQRIKQELRYNPYIILLTQVTGTSNVIKALEAGADEFLTKPFNMAELRSRLQVGAKIVDFKNRLKTQNEELEKFISSMESMAEERARELLLHSDFIMVLGKLTLQISNEISECLETANIKSENVADNFKERIHDLHHNLKQVINLIQSLQKHSVKYSSKLTLCKINEVVEDSIEIFQVPLAHTRKELVLAKDLPDILVDKIELKKAIVGLILNTLEFLKNETQGILRMETAYIKDKKVTLLIIECNGAKISNNELGRVLQPYWGFEQNANVKIKMSVAMSRDILQKFGSTLRIEAREEGGIRFIIDLPNK